MNTEAKATPIYRRWQKPFYMAALAWGVVAALLSYQRIGTKGAVTAAITLFGLVLGIKITEYLVAVLTRVASANRAAVVLLFGLKLLWWAGIFFAMRLVSPDMVFPVALGVGSFLLAILSAGFLVAGAPKISFRNESDT